MHCYLVVLQALQRLVEENKTDCYLVVLQVLQRLTGEMRLGLLSGHLPGFAISQFLSSRAPGFVRN